MNAGSEDAVLLDHIIEAITVVLDYTKGMDLNAFLGNRLVQDGTIRNFMVIGEAVKRLSPEIRERHATIPWKKIAGMRDKLVHDHLGIDKVAVWLTVDRVLPKALVDLQQIRRGLS